MTYDRKMLGRLAIVFGISTFSYGIAGIVATHARDQLIARVQMQQEMQSQSAGSGIAAERVGVSDASQIDGPTGSIGQRR
jgi:hypothetical protein